MKKKEIFLLGLVLMFVLAACQKTDYYIQVNEQGMTKETYEARVEEAKTYMEAYGVSFEEENQDVLNNVKEQVKEEVVQELLIKGCALTEGVMVEAEDVEDFLNKQVKSSFETVEDYETWLGENNFSEEAIKEKIEFGLLEQALFQFVTQEITVAEEDALTYYEDNKDQWDSIQVSHILIAADRDNTGETELAQARDKAYMVIRKLELGEKFDDLAKSFSDDPGSGAKGGVLEMTFTKNDSRLVPEFVKGAYLLKEEGEYSQVPVQTQYGYHIIQLDKVYDSFEDVKESILEQLSFDLKRAEYENYILAKREQATIIDKTNVDVEKISE